MDKIGGIAHEFEVAYQPREVSKAVGDLATHFGLWTRNEPLKISRNKIIANRSQIGYDCVEFYFRMVELDIQTRKICTGFEPILT